MVEIIAKAREDTGLYRKPSATVEHNQHPRSIPPFSRSSINFLEHNGTAGDQLSHNSLSQRQELSKIPAGLAVRIAPDNQLSHFTGWLDFKLGDILHLTNAAEII